MVALQKNETVLEKIDGIINNIKEMLLRLPETTTVGIDQIAHDTKFSIEEISFLLHLVSDYGSFYNGSSSEQDSRILKSIRVEGSDAIYYDYIQFPGIRKLILLKSYQSFTPKDDEFTIDEMMTMSAKIDSILEEQKEIKIGQEVIWTDMQKELDELKGLYSLNKKNWRQLLTGKMVEMVAGGIISETVSKKIIDVVNPVFMKLLN